MKSEGPDRTSRVFNCVHRSITRDAQCKKRRTCTHFFKNVPGCLNQTFWHFSDFGRVFHGKIPSFKIAMSGRAGWRASGGRRPRFIFVLTFYKNDMLPLFFSGKPVHNAVRLFFLFP